MWAGIIGRTHAQCKPSPRRSKADVLRDALEEGTLFVEDAAGLFNAGHIFDGGTILPEGITVIFIGGEVWKGNQRESRIRRAGEFGGQEIANQVPAAAANGFGPGARIFFEIRVSVLVNFVANTKRDQGVVPFFPGNDKGRPNHTEMLHPWMKHACARGGTLGP